jgi:hypothetical protein
MSLVLSLGGGRPAGALFYFINKRTGFVAGFAIGSPEVLLILRISERPDKTSASSLPRFASIYLYNIFVVQ